MDIMTQLSLIADGIDPMTGEVFDTEILASDPAAQRALIILSSYVFSNCHFKKPVAQNLLNRPVEEICQKLRDLRLDLAAQVNLPAYCIFDDVTMYNIAGGDIMTKEDLLRVKGIGKKRYELYGDAVFDIIAEYID